MKTTEKKEYEFCLRCGRKLKSQETRMIGFGKICEKKMKTNKEKMMKLF